RASASTALGYTMPLVMPPFMTRSQYFAATSHLPSVDAEYGKTRSHSLRKQPQLRRVMVSLDHYRQRVHLAPAEGIHPGVHATGWI
ncbi:MAG: hypothetical protein ACN6PX_09325, partial [Stenotrophomonas lactitubi]